jgi:hypothetical protein
MFFDCNRRLAEGIDQSQLLSLFAMRLLAPPAAKWSALPSVVTWTLRRVAGAAQITGRQAPVDQPITP